MKRVFAASAVALMLGCVGSHAGETPAPDGARAYIIEPANGTTVQSPFKVVFGLEGMGVAPAGVEKEKTGHHHLIIDTPPEEISLDEAIPSDEQHRHFGGGQTETMVELEPGRHTLQLVLGDQNHVPHSPPVMSDRITIIVGE